MRSLLFIPVAMLMVGCASEPSKYDKQRMEIQKEEAKSLIDQVNIDEGDEIEMKDTFFGDNKKIILKN
jgi:hypothetical protein